MLSNSIVKHTHFDERREIIIPGNKEETILFSAQHFLKIGAQAIQKKGNFSVALSGGSTPHAIFKELAKSVNDQTLDWSRVFCFWSDERSSPPNNLENNYFSAMEAGLKELPLLPENIFRMHAEENIEENARLYEHLILKNVPSAKFDLIMLGMGEDGHTASLFPSTDGLEATKQLVIANYVPQKKTWRMSFTYECIHKAENICIYATGLEKAKMIKKVFLGAYVPKELPVQAIGTVKRKATWILDSEASSELLKSVSIKCSL